MAATKYTYSIANDTANGKVNSDKLKYEIQKSLISIALNNGSEGQISTGGDDLEIWFAATLSLEDTDILTAIVSSHDGLDSDTSQVGQGFIYPKTWTEMRAILDANNLYFDYEDKDSVRTITVQRNSTSTYICKIQIVQSPIPGSDQYDFEQNYMSKAGEKTYAYWTERNTFTKNATSHFLFQLKDVCDGGQNAVDAFVFKGFISVDENAKRGDIMVAAIVDHDNVLGQGVDTVLGFLVRKATVSAANERIPLMPPSVDYIVNKKRVPGQFWIRISYTAQNTLNDVDLIAGIEYEY